MRGSIYEGKIDMKRILSILALVVTLLAILTPILWTYYVGRRALEARILSSISLLEKDPILDELTISYRDKVVTNITKTRFFVINTGKTPITEDEVKAFPTIDFGQEAEILDTKILRTDPPNIVCNIMADQHLGKVTLRFRLLNPTDFVDFSVYVTGPIEKSPTIDARIEGIKQISIVDKTAEQIEAPRRTVWPVYIASVFIVFFGILILFAVKEILSQRRTRNLLTGNPHLLEAMTDKSQFKTFITDRMGFIAEKQREELQSILNDDTKDFQDRKAQLIELLTQRIGETAASTNALYFFIVCVSVLIIYVFWQLFH